MCLYFFFFKQKTAYEMRISDWSSDVCSSDLQDPGGEGVTAVVQLVNARSVALIAGQARNAAPQRGIAGIRDVCRSCPQFQARQRIEQADSDTRRQQNERQPAQALQDQHHVSAQVKRQDQARATLRSPKASTTRKKPRNRKLIPTQKERTPRPEPGPLNSHNPPDRKSVV